MEEENVSPFVEWEEEWNALNVVPVKMSHEDVGVYRVLTELTKQALAQRADTAPAVQDD
jgi:hypothetical protein